MSSNSLVTLLSNPGPKEAILDHLQHGWQGPLAGADYAAAIVKSAQTAVDRTAGHVKEGENSNNAPAPPPASDKALQVLYPSLELLGVLGADLSGLNQVKGANTNEPQDDYLSDSEKLSRLASGREWFKSKLRGQLENDTASDMMQQNVRVTVKGMLLAHLEEKHKGGKVSEEFLTSAKRSLVLDATGMSKGVQAERLEKELDRLEVDQADSFVWCSLSGAMFPEGNHAMDTVARKVKRNGRVQYELTTCNRGAGVVQGADGKAEALCSYWDNAAVLAKAWAKTTVSAGSTSEEYFTELHPNKQERNPMYRSQKLQYVDNCGTKSLFAALNLLTAAPGHPDLYKTVKESMKCAMGASPKPPRPAPALQMEQVNFRRDLRILKPDSGNFANDLAKLVDTKLDRPNKVPDAETKMILNQLIGGDRALKQKFEYLLK